MHINFFDKFYKPFRETFLLLLYYEFLFVKSSLEHKKNDKKKQLCLIRTNI